MRVKQLIMKILIASLAMTAVVGLPRGQVKPKRCRFQLGKQFKHTRHRRPSHYFNKWPSFRMAANAHLLAAFLLFTVLTYGDGSNIA